MSINTLHLPIRGQFRQMTATRSSLFLVSEHAEDAKLGLYHIALADLQRGTYTPESSLNELTGSASMTWVGSSPDRETLWAIDSDANLYQANELNRSEDSEDNRGNTSLKLNTIGSLLEVNTSKISEVFACAIDHQRLCYVSNDSYSATNSTTDHEQSDSTNTQGARIFIWSLSEDPGVSWQGTVESKVSSITYGQGCIAFGLENGSVALLFVSPLSPDEVERPYAGPFYVRAHDARVTAVGLVHAERAYLISYAENLKLAQTRLDDLAPMPRALKGKGLHTQPVTQIVSGPLGRFYSIGRDRSVKAWHNAYSNYRPASHDDWSGLLDGDLLGGFVFDLPQKDLKAKGKDQWTTTPSLGLFTQNHIAFYSLNTEAHTGTQAEVSSGEGGSLGRLGSPLCAFDGAEPWARYHLKLSGGGGGSINEAEEIAAEEAMKAASGEVTEGKPTPQEHPRKRALNHVISWGDSLSLSLCAQIAGRDPVKVMREISLDAILTSDHPKVISHLDALLKAEYAQTAIRSLSALQKAFGSESLHPMRRALETGGTAVAKAAIEALKTRVIERDESALQLIKDTLNHQDCVTAEIARGALEDIVDGPKGVLLGLKSDHQSVRLSAIYQMYSADHYRHAMIQGSLQALRADHEYEIRHAALAASLLSVTPLDQLLRADDTLLHDALRKFVARGLSGDARTDTLATEQPEKPSADEITSECRQLLFELTSIYTTAPGKSPSPWL